jgi:hypothetical protein
MITAEALKTAQWPCPLRCSGHGPSTSILSGDFLDRLERQAQRIANNPNAFGQLEAELAQAGAQLAALPAPVTSTMPEIATRLRQRVRCHRAARSLSVIAQATGSQKVSASSLRLRPSPSTRQQLA